MIASSSSSSSASSSWVWLGGSLEPRVQSRYPDDSVPLYSVPKAGGLWGNLELDGSGSITTNGADSTT